MGNLRFSENFLFYTLGVLLLQIFLSFLLVGLAVALQTLIAERLSHFWRGIALTIPSTMALGLLFIGLTKSPDDVVQAATIVPAALGPTYLFVFVFAALAEFGLMVSIVVGFMAWTLFAAVLLLFPPSSFLLSTLISVCSISGIYVLARLLPHRIPPTVYGMTVERVLLRSLFGGIVIATVVVLSKTLGNTWGGLFSSFPAGFSSTLIIYYLSSGPKAVQGVAKTMFFPGTFGFILYASIVALTFPVLGVWIGTLMAYVGVALFFAAWVLLRRSIVLK
jgi:uncharacterized membrane protein (GlpM family)